jgi:hypothetical protein
VHGAEGDRVLGGQELHHGADLQAQQLDAGAHRLLHEVREARALQRVLAQPGDRRLLRRAQLQLGLGVLLVGDVGHHAVPALEAVGPLAHDRVVADPHGVAVAVQQPVLDGGGERGPAVGELLLLGEDALGVVGVQPARPHPRVRAPCVRGEAQDLLDLRAHVVPAAIAAGISGVEDRGDPLQEQT